MNLRISLQRILLTLIGVCCLPISASALPPFDITDQKTRPVEIWFDKNSVDPSLVGDNLVFAYNGMWTSGGTTGTIVVAADEVIAVYSVTGLPGVPADEQNWTDQTIEINIATGHIESMSQAGKLTIVGVSGDLPFSYDLNTTYDDTLNSTEYTMTGFVKDVSFGDNEKLTIWCTDENPGQVGEASCPPYNGPAPFAYNSSTGRFNAIGGAELNTAIFIYATFGDAQLFEAPVAPALSDPMIAVLVLALLAIGTRYFPREAGAV